MSNLIHYKACPVCLGTHIKFLFYVKDFTVSKNEFGVWECQHCTLRFTQDVPNQSSIAPYYQSEDYISHTDNDKGFINKVYRIVRKRTLTQKRKLIQKITGLAKGALLDIGSGTGNFIAEMKVSGWEVTGLEPDAGARQIALAQHNVKLQTIETFYSLPPASFDAITLWHVLEHVHDLPAYLKQLHSLLRPNGKLIIAVPNYTAKEAAVYKAYWAAYDVPRHLYHFSPKSMQELANRNNFAIETMKPMVYDSFYISLLSSKYKNGKPNLIAAFFNGLFTNISAIGKPQKSSSVIYVLNQLDIKNAQ